VDVTGHRSRVLDRAALPTADLVVGFEPFHVSAAVVDGGAARDRCFTIRELDSLLDGAMTPHGLSVVERARATVATANARRAADATGLAARTLGDPYGRPRRVYEQTAADIDVLVTRLATALFGPPAIQQAV